MVVIDTNILIHGSNASSQQHAECRDYLESLRSSTSAWFLTWNVVYEFLRIVSHPRVLARPWDPKPAWTFIEALSTSPNCEILCATERHQDVLSEFLEEFPDTRGNLVHDARTVVHMREHGVATVCSYDRDFLRFGVNVVTPSAA